MNVVFYYVLFPIDFPIFNSLYHTLKELEQDLNFDVFEATNEKNLNNLVSTLQNYIIVTSKKNSNKKQYLILDKLPISNSGWEGHGVIACLSWAQCFRHECAAKKMLFFRNLNSPSPQKKT